MRRRRVENMLVTPGQRRGTAVGHRGESGARAPLTHHQATIYSVMHWESSPNSQPVILVIHTFSLPLN